MKKNLAIIIGILVVLAAIPATVFTVRYIQNYASYADENDFPKVCPSEASCEGIYKFNYWQDCMAFGHIVAKVVDVTSGSEVDVTNQYNSDNRLNVETRQSGDMWTVKKDSSQDGSYGCSGERKFANWGKLSCAPSVLTGGSTYSEGKPVASTDFMCFNGNFDLVLKSLPEGYELTDITINQDSRTPAGRGGTADVTNKKVNNINICNDNYGSGGVETKFQMTHNYVFKVRQKAVSQKPVCKITNVPSPAAGKAPLTVKFDGSGSLDSDGTITKYVWKIGEEVVSDKNIFERLFTTAGSFVVTLVVEDNTALTSDICTVNVTVGNKVPPVCKITTVPSPATGKIPLTVSFNGSGSLDSDGTISKYEWKIGTEVVSTQMTFSRVFSTAGTYELTLVVEDSDALKSDICKVTVTPTEEIVKAPPVCKITTVPDPAQGYVPLTVKFDGSGSTDSDGTITKYVWKIGTEVVSSTNIFSRNFTTEGSYDVTLVVNDNDNLTSEICSVKVRPLNKTDTNKEPVCKIKSSPENQNGKTVPVTITFNGKESYDSDGTVKDHRWKIKRDGKEIANFDKSEFKYKFDKDGKYDIYLEVEDNKEVTGDTCHMDFTLKEAAKEVVVPKPVTKPAVPKTGSFDVSVIAAIVAAVALVGLGLLLVL